MATSGGPRVGTLVTISCPRCGYATTLGLGIGMGEIEVGTYKCDACHELSALSDGALRCEHCGATELRQWPLQEESVSAPCPQCGTAAEVAETGIWD